MTKDIFPVSLEKNIYTRDTKFMYLVKGMASTVIPSMCNGCQVCIPRCPHGAISLVSGKAYIDPGKCHNAHVCISVCTKHAIVPA